MFVLWVFTAAMSVSLFPPYLAQEFADNNAGKAAQVHKLLADGTAAMDLGQQSRNQSIVLVIGNSGAGKTTVAKFLCGYPLESYLAKDDSFLIKDTENKISVQSSVSKTTVPEMYSDDTTGTIFYDLPGFKDTRSPEVSLANSVFMKMVADHAARLKIMIVMPHKFLRRSTGERNAIKTLLQHTTDFMKNIEKFKPSISLMVTFVEAKASDDRVIASIHTFLTNIKSELPSTFQNHTYNLHGSLVLIDALTDLSSSGTPNKISVFRQPSDAGLLSEFPEMVECKKRGLQMIHEGSQWIENDEKSEFGYPVSEDSRSLIIILSNSFNTLFSKVVQNLAGKTGEFFDAEQADILEDLQAFRNETFDRILIAKHKVEEFADVVMQLKSGLSPANVILMLTNLLQTEFPKVWITLSEPITDLSQQCNFMQTLKSISNEVTFQTERWFLPLGKFSDDLKAKIEQNLTTTSRYLSDVFNAEFLNVTQSIAINLDHQFTTSLEDIVKDLASYRNETYSNIANMKSDAKKLIDLLAELKAPETSPAVFAIKLNNLLQARFPSISNSFKTLLSTLLERAYFMLMLTNFSNERVTFENQRWIQPLEGATRELHYKIEHQLSTTSRHVSDVFNAEFCNVTQSIAINLDNHFTTALEDIEQNLRAYSNGTYAKITIINADAKELMNLLVALNSMETTPTDLATKIKDLLEARFSIIWNILNPTVSSLLERINFMNMLKSVSNESVTYQNDRWVQPLDRIRREIEYKIQHNLSDTRAKLYKILKSDSETLLENICTDWRIEVNWELFSTRIDMLESTGLTHCEGNSTKNGTCDFVYQNVQALVGVHKYLLQELLGKLKAANNANNFFREIQRTLFALISRKKFLSHFVSKTLKAVHKLKWKILAVEEAKETNGTSITSPNTAPLLKLQQFIDRKLEIILPLEARIEIDKLENKIVQLITNVGDDITKFFHETMENVSSSTDFQVFQQDLIQSKKAALDLTSAQNCTSLTLKIKALTSSPTLKSFKNPYLIKLLEDMIQVEQRYKIECKVSHLSSSFETLVSSADDLIQKPINCILSNEDFSGSILIQSNYVQMSKAMECIVKHQLTSIVLEATHAVIFDRNFYGTKISPKHAINLVILSPLWISARNAVIDLSGSPGEAYPKPGVKSDGTGKDGLLGLPGVSGGNFIGRGIHLRGGKLSILSNGGNGGDGQDGGNGEDGISTENLETLDQVLTDHELKLWYYILLRCTCFSPITCHGNKNQRPGTNGKSGGNGGVGGNGGYSGSVDILSLPDVLIVTEQGKHGRPGIGGRGGSAGKNGDGMVITVIKGGFLCFFQTSVKKARSVPSIFPPNQRGSDGLNGVNNKDIKQPEQLPITSTLKYELHYKKYLIEQLTSNASLFFPFTLPFLKLFNSQPTNNNYFIAIRANFQDFQYLEERFYRTKHSRDLQHFYSVLFTRSSALKTELERESDSESQRAMNLLVAVIFDRLTLLQQSSLLTDLVVDFAGFASHSTQSATILGKVQEQVRKSNVTAIAQETTTSQIKTKLSEAEEIIDNEIQPEILKLEDDINKQIDSILQTIEDLKKNEIQNKKQLEEQQERLNKLGWLRHVSSGLQVIGTVASFFGPKGAVVGALANGISSTTDSALGIDSVNTNVNKLPDVILQESNSFFKNIQNRKLSRKNKLQQELNDVKTEIDLIPELQPLKNKIEAAQEQLESPANEGDSVNGVVNSVTETLQNALSSILESSTSNDDSQPSTSTEPTENASPKPKATKTKRILKSLDKCLKIVKLGSELYNKYKDDEGKLEELSSAIQKSAHNIQALEVKADSIVNELLPTFSAIASDLQEQRNDFGKKGTSALLLSKWKIQNVLSDLKFNIRKSFTEGLQQEEYISRAVDKIELGFTTMISIYNDLQAYHRQSDLTKFVADVNANNNFEFKNQDLQEMYLDLKRIMLSNTIVQDHEDLMRTFKLWVFPFAYLFLKPEGLVAAKPTKDKDVVDMAELAKHEIQRLADKLESYRTKSYKGMDNLIIINNFIKTNTSVPFYTWTSRRFVGDLLSGNITTAVVDILKHPYGNLATKFNEIWISIQCSQFTANNCSQEHLNYFLNKFGVKMKHSGNNQFGYNDKYYTMTSTPQEIFFSFEKGRDGKFNQRSTVYDKLAANAAILSPFTRWQFQIVTLRGAAVNDTDWKVLRSYRDLVEVHLEGKGTFVEFSHDTNGVIANNLDKYYTPDTSLYLKSLLLQD